MAPKRAFYLSYGEDEKCAETKKFIESSGVVLQVRDVAKNPLTVRELTLLFGHLKLDHFLNTSAPSFHEQKLDSIQPSRTELIKMIAADYTLLRRPIVKAGRLVMVGCDQKKIGEMLQIVGNGTGQEKDPPQPVRHSRQKKSHAGRS